VRRTWDRLNPTLRGFLIIAAIAVAVVALNLYTALLTVSILLRVAFFLAIAFFIFLMWRERRGEIEEWPGRARASFYGAALLIVVDLGAYFWRGAPSGLGAGAFIATLVLCALAMWRVWRDQHTFS
jgi:small-conductance mechanosensitive channel